MRWINPAPVPPTVLFPHHLSLPELEEKAAEYAHLGVSILAAGDEWILDVCDAGRQLRFRAWRVVPGESA